jgi:phosphate transport system permease protein
MRKIIEKSFFISTRAIFISVVSVFIAILFYLFYKGIQYFEIHLLFSDFELLASLQGTILLVILSVIFATPIGVATAVFIHSYSSKKIKYILDFSFELLASIPSIIIGLFGFSILLILHDFFPDFRASLLLASASLAILILPYSIKTTIIGLQEVPKDFINLTYSLGATKEQVIIYTMFPFAKIHILKGIFLSIARACEDTAVIMLTGVVASYGMADSLFSPFEALPFYIFYTTANYTSENEQNTIFVAIILLVIISSFFMFLVKVLTKRTKWLK